MEQTNEIGGMSLKEEEKNKQDKAKERLAQTPLVSAILKTFDRAKISGFKLNTQAEEMGSDDLIDTEDI